MTQKRKPTVLFFDSGMGGLSVFTEAWKLNRDAAFYYLFDHECFPYGNKSEVFLRRRVSALLKAVSDELHPDLIVIACNQYHSYACHKRYLQHSCSRCGSGHQAGSSHQPQQTHCPAGYPGYSSQSLYRFPDQRICL